MVTAPTTSTNHGFYPEMGEVADLGKLLLAVDHIGGSTFVETFDYNLAEVKALFKTLRIRPNQLPTGRRNVVAFQLTQRAWRKLRDLGVCNVKLLLD